MNLLYQLKYFLEIVVLINLLDGSLYNEKELIK